MAADAEQGARDAVAAPIARGTNQAGMREQNERLVLSLVRRHGALAKSEIARMTGLSVQTVSVIMRHLESDHLLRRGAPQRGRVGQPMVPLSLDPEGAFFIGVKVGRRSLDIVLVDFVGGIRHRAGVAYPFPTPDRTIRRIVEEVGVCQRLLGNRAERIAGVGLALPFELWSWAEEIGAPEAEMAAWRGVDLRSELAARLPYPVYLQNDATAACGAELAFGDHAGLMDFIYFYVGAFVGGGLVLNGGLFAGRTGNAAALGSMPVPDGAGGSAQLIDRASLVVLERSLRAAGLPLDALYDPTGDWDAVRRPPRPLDRDRRRRHRLRDRRRGGDHRLRGGGDRRRVSAGRADPAARRGRRRAAAARPFRHRPAGAAARHHRPGRARARRRQPAALRPLPARSAYSRRSRPLTSRCGELPRPNVVGVPPVA